MTIRSLRNPARERPRGKKTGRTIPPWADGVSGAAGGGDGASLRVLAPALRTMAAAGRKAFPETR
ncbi:MAG TPA: hypothetical protein PKI53_01950, partial [Candidatus Aminicenantes bacterium]|nr:hypothetical protein [Candidatus Aminicenantes bacterium]